MWGLIKLGFLKEQLERKDAVVLQSWLPGAGTEFSMAGVPLLLLVAVRPPATLPAPTFLGELGKVLLQV